MMKSVLQTLQNQPCREREIGENEKDNFSNYLHLQRYHPALDIFKIPESSLSHKNLELSSKYHIASWSNQDETNQKIWNTTRTIYGSTTSEPCKTFVKTVHLLNPIDLIKEKYTIPEHPLLPQSENTWKKTLLKLHSHNNQAYVDTVANFVLSAFRENNLTPHCVLYYGAATGISKKYQYNISLEYDTYRQCRWFWKGMKSHSARLTVIRGDADVEEIPNFEEIYKDITSCPFEDTDSEVSEIELEPVTDKDVPEISDVESIKSFTFDNIEEDAQNVKDIFEINKKVTKRVSLKKNESSSDEESSSDSDGLTSSEGSDESVELDLDICLEIPNMPVVLIYQEAQEGVMDNLLDKDEIDEHKRGSQGWEARWIAWLFQVISVLSFLQNAICFTHNDLHSNNILWRKTDKKFLFYKAKDGTIWRVPTFGKIFTVIDFGRSIFRLGKHLWVSDDHWPDQEAGDQYNFGPFFDHTLPKNPPNPSFDLCRLSVSLLDGLFDEAPPKKKGKGVSIMSQEDSWKVYETNSPLYNLLWSWTINKDGHTIYEDKNGDEKYEGFDLYVRIAHDIHNAVPKDQIHKPVFSQFKWKQKVPQDETIYSIGA
uniref:Protein kinase domain-containing protein n=1 Tax=viral metagenome TaxID=1070528 RepID=A0A6C0DUW7_9ZZZZ